MARLLYYEVCKPLRGNDLQCARPAPRDITPYVVTTYNYFGNLLELVVRPLDKRRYIVYTKSMIRNNDNKKGNQMTKINFNNIEIVKVHFRHYFAKYDGKTIEGTRYHTEAGARVRAKKILKDQAVVDNGIYYVV